LASVLQLLKLPDGTVKVLVEGATRAKVLKYTDRVDYYEADATAIVDDTGDRVEAEAMARSVVTEFENYVKLNKKVSPEVVGAIQQTRITQNWPTRLLRIWPPGFDKQDILRRRPSPSALKRCLG
jgi:ATP-dependent Lon protease